jgi:hypothetical protein
MGWEDADEIIGTVTENFFDADESRLADYIKIALLTAFPWLFLFKINYIDMTLKAEQDSARSMSFFANAGVCGMIVAALLTHLFGNLTGASHVKLAKRNNVFLLWMMVNVATALLGNVWEESTRQ